MVQLINPGPIEFDDVIKHNDEVSNSGAWVTFPHNLKVTYGKGNLVPVRITFDGTVQYQGSLANMGGEGAMILLRKDIRERLGKGPGDRVHVRVELDTSERKIKLDDDVTKVLKASPKALAFWDGLSFSHQREYYLWITEAKQAETRTRRITKMIEMLEAGRKDAR